MDQNTYEVGESAVVYLSFNRDVRFNLIKDGAGGKETILQNKAASAGKHKIPGTIEGPPGTKTLTVAARDSSGNQASDTVRYRVEGKDRPPQASCEITPSEAEVGERVRISAADSRAPDGHIVAYKWDLTGNGRTDERGRIIRHSFDDPGYHSVSLKVEDSNGSTDSTTCSIRVQEAEAELKVVVLSTEGDRLDARIYIDNTYKTRSGSDGSVRLDLEPGRYTVKASKSDYEDDQESTYLSSGEEETVVLRLKPEADPPKARFQYDPSNPEEDETVTFNASSSTAPDGTIENYRWDIDGEQAKKRGRVVTHTFSSAGTYEVELEVEDSNGLTDTTSRTVRVEEKERETELVIKDLEVLGEGTDPKEFEPKDMLRIKTELKNQGPIAVGDPSCKFIFPSLGKTFDENFPSLHENSTKTKTVNWLIPEDANGGIHRGQIICSGDSSEGTVKAAADDTPEFEIVKESSVTTLRLARGEKLTGSYDSGDELRTRVLLENDGPIPIDESLSCTFLVFEPQPTKLKGSLKDTSVEGVDPEGKVLVPLKGKLTSNPGGGTHKGEGTLICKGSSSQGNVVPYTGELGYDFQTRKNPPKPKLDPVSADTLILGGTGVIIAGTQILPGVEGGYIRLKLHNTGGKATGGTVEVSLPEVLEITGTTGENVEKSEEGGRKLVNWNLEEGVPARSQAEYFVKVKMPGPGVIGELKEHLFGYDPDTSDLQVRIQVELQDSETSKSASKSVDIGLINPEEMANLAEKHRKAVKSFYRGFAEGIRGGNVELLTETTNKVVEAQDNGTFGDIWSSAVTNLPPGANYPGGLVEGVSLIKINAELMDKLKDATDNFYKNNNPAYRNMDLGYNYLVKAEESLERLEEALAGEREAWETRDRSRIEKALGTTQNVTDSAISYLEGVSEVRGTEGQQKIAEYAEQVIDYLEDYKDLTSNLLDTLRGDRRKWM
ncbi:MAG: PKD domain-containing protein [Thermoproteota archaeon]